MNYKETIKAIEKKLSNKYGAIQIITKKAECTRTVYYSAMKKEDWDDLTDKEITVIKEAISYIEELDNLKQKAASL